MRYQTGDDNGSRDKAAVGTPILSPTAVAGTMTRPVMPAAGQGQDLRGGDRGSGGPEQPEQPEQLQQLEQP